MAIAAQHHQQVRHHGHAPLGVQLDDERKAAMVSNLLVVLCGDREAQPVVNTGTIYQ